VAILATIGTWLASYGLGALLKFASDSLGIYLAQRTADNNAKDVGAAQAREEQSRATIAAQEAELQAQADAPQSVDDAIKRLEGGSA
jgi:hypothetical protein